MQRAATGPGHGLPAAARPRPTDGGSSLLVGGGNNGGDALFAGALLAGRGVQVTAVLLDRDRAHPAGLAALRRAGGRVLDAGGATAAIRRGPTSCSTAWSGIGGQRRSPARPQPSSPGGAARARASPWPSTSPAASTPPPGRSPASAFPAMHTVTFGAVKLGPRRGGGPRRRRPGAPDRHRPGRPPARARAFRLTDADVAARLRRRPATTTSTPRAWSGVVAGSATYPGAAVLCTGAALRTRPGLVRYAGTAADGVRAAWPEAIVTAGPPGDAGRVQAWVVGPGMGTDDDARSVPGRGAGHRPAGGRRRRRADDAGRASRHWSATGARRPCSPRTTGSSPGFGVERRAPTGSPPPAGWPPTWAPSSCSRATPPSSPDPDGTAFVNAHRHARGWPPPAPATCCPGSPARVLLRRATGLPAVEAAAVAAHLHGRAGQLAAERGPLIAGDLVRCLPDAVGRVRGSRQGGLGDFAVVTNRSRLAGRGRRRPRRHRRQHRRPPRARRPAAHGRGEGRRLRARARAGRPRGARRRCRLPSASPSSTRHWRCARPA